jgi:hypothetical protein
VVYTDAGREDMEYILYAISAICLGIGVYFYYKNRNLSKLLQYLEIAARISPPKWDDALVKSIQEALEGRTEKKEETVKKMK